MSRRVRSTFLGSARGSRAGDGGLAVANFFFSVLKAASSAKFITNKFVAASRVLSPAKAALP